MPPLISTPSAGSVSPVLTSDHPIAQCVDLRASFRGLFRFAWDDTHGAERPDYGESKRHGSRSSGVASEKSSRGVDGSSPHTARRDGEHSWRCPASPSCWAARSARRTRQR